MVELVVRLVFSLAVVLGMLLLLTRFSAKKFRGGADAPVRVLHRQPLSRTSAVAVVTVGSRVLVLGTTEHQVQLLTELEPDELEVPAPVLPVYDDQAGLVGEPAYRGEPAFGEEPEFTTLDELFGGSETSGSLDDLEPAYTPRHADTPVSVPQVTPAARATPSVRPAPAAAQGALAGSVLSASTWKQAFAAATSRNRDVS